VTVRLAGGKHPIRLAYQPPGNSTFSQNKPAISNQPTVLFSQNKLAPAISHQPNEQAERKKCFQKNDSRQRQRKKWFQKLYNI
jgi:hypothetical protein